MSNYSKYQINVVSSLMEFYKNKENYKPCNVKPGTGKSNIGKTIHDIHRFKDNSVLVFIPRYLWN